MTKRRAVKNLVESAVSRRTFARNAIAAGVALGVGGAVIGKSADAQAQSLTDADILNFALNLEYLEAEFYTVLTSGLTIDLPPFDIPITGVGTQGPTTGATRLNFSGNTLIEQTAAEVAVDERAHVMILRQALGSAAVAKPAIDFAPGAVTSVARFLQVSRVLEDVGVSAYGGAAPLISSSAILATAARIALVEAEHSGNIRLHVAQTGVGNIGPVDAKDVLVGTPATPSARLFFVDQTGLTPVRTPSEVLSIVYGPGAPPGTSSGLLFPNGVNGTIRTV